MTGKPVVLVDMDGPLADFDRRFYDLCSERGWPMHSTFETQCHRFATDCMTEKAHAKAARAEVDSSRWFLDLPVVDGAVDGLHKLAEVADVWICTKPLEANATCRDDKAAWLGRHFGERWLPRLILAPDKSMVRGHVLLDDAPKPAWFPLAAWRPVIFPTAWNGSGSEWEGLPRWSWVEDPEALLEHAYEASRPEGGAVGQVWEKNS